MEMFHYRFVILPLLSLPLLFNLFSVNCNTVGQCLEVESSALLQLKRGFTSSKLDAWRPGTDCCTWEGVTCDESKRVIGLDLSNRNMGGKIDPIFFNLTSLRSLDISWNNFDRMPIPDYGWDRLANISTLYLADAGYFGEIPDGIFHLTKLTSLDLSYNGRLYLSANATFWQNMSNLRELYLDHVDLSKVTDEWCETLVNSTPALEKLSMYDCSLFGSSCSSLSKLHFLSVLNLGANNLDFGILNSFVNLTSLSELRVAINGFKGGFPKQILQLKNLIAFDIASNPMLSGHLPDFLEGSNLEILNIHDTNLSGNIPDTISNLKFLKGLDLSRCQFSGRIPPSMGNLSQLELLDLSSNNFNDVVGLEFIKNFKNLNNLDLSNSGFSLSSWDTTDGGLLSFSFPNILYLGLANCNLTKIPSFIKHQKMMDYLDLSNNKIHGEIPSWFEGIFFLNLSCNFFTNFTNPPFNTSAHLIDLHSNMFEGHFPNFTSANYLSFLDFSNNHLTSSIPYNISSYSSLEYLSLANNNLTGEIPPSICNLTELRALDLSINILAGSIPPCLLEEDMNLQMLNLQGNQLHGAIPHQINPRCMLQFINLRDNQLEGLLPRSLSNCRLLESLDVEKNNLNDTFPYWLGNMTYLRVLILRSNKFHGLVGPIEENQEIYHNFSKLHVLDISSNNFSGKLCANYFSNFTSMMINKADTIYMDYYEFELGYGLNKLSIIVEKHYVLDKLTVMNKGQLMTLPKYWTMFKSIDFSNNYFEGEIPISISQLLSLQGLNLSQNYLTGEIPPQLGKLTKLESFDLSKNRLVGKIPQDLVALTALSYLNLSYNKLVGPIPSGGQFSTFPNTSFEGNEGLCWLPCTPAINNTDSSVLGLGGTTSTNRSSMIVLGLLFGVGFGASMAITIVIITICCVKGKRRRSTTHG